MKRECPYGLGDLDLRQFESASTRKGISGMRLSHTPARISTAFDDPNLVASAGLVPVMGLAHETGSGTLMPVTRSLTSCQGTRPLPEWPPRTVTVVLLARTKRRRRPRTTTRSPTATVAAVAGAAEGLT